MARGRSYIYDHDIKQQAFRHLMVLECSESTQTLRLGLIISLKIRGLKLVLILSTVFGVQKPNMQYRYIFLNVLTSIINQFVTYSFIHLCV